MSASALIGVTPTIANVTTAATGDVSLSAGDEVLLIPTTRVVTISSVLPTASAGISAQWMTSPASRVSGGMYEHAEIRCFVDLTALTTVSNGATGDVIGVAAAVASLGQITAAQFGTILGGEMLCLQAPTGGTANIDLHTNTTALAQDAVSAGAAGAVQIVNADADTTDWTLGKRVGFSAIPAAGSYLHLTKADGGSGTYNAGKFMITFYCRYTL